MEALKSLYIPSGFVVSLPDTDKFISGPGPSAHNRMFIHIMTSREHKEDAVAFNYFIMYHS